MLRRCLSAALVLFFLGGFLSLPSTLSGKVTAEIRLVKGTAALKTDPKGKGKGDSATYEFWLTPKTSGYTISKDEAKNIKVAFVATAV